MKIQNAGARENQVTKGAGSQKNVDNLAQQLKSKNTESSAKLKMSERAQSFQKAKAIASDSSINEAKVARLQKMIDSGQYKVNANILADRVLDEHLSFPSGQ